MIDWFSEQTHLILNPRHQEAEKRRLEKSVQEYSVKESIWLRSSGTESQTQGIKLVQLSKSNILAAAKSVNAFFNVSKTDRWLNPLPEFHIGGLSISARCILAGAQEVTFVSSWSPQEFAKKLAEEKITLTSLVPTQVFDLLEAGISCPAHLRAVLVGGGKLNRELWLKASDLGWKLFPSYGMTETSAAMACCLNYEPQSDEIPWMEILPHIHLEQVKGRIQINSTALFSSYLFVEDHKISHVPKPNPFFLDDHLQISGSSIKVLGRENELVKILGETVNLNILEEKISKKIKKSVVIQAIEDQRRGFVLRLWVESDVSSMDLDLINSELMPFERMQMLKFVSKFPKADIGKIKKSVLFQMNE